MKKNINIIIVALSAIFFLSFKPVDINDDIDKVRNKEITKDEIYIHIKYLSSDDMEGRFPGTRGDSLTDHYLEKEYEKYNLVSLGSDGYLQPFEMVTQMQFDGTNEFQIASSGNSNSFSLEKDFIPFGFSGNGKAQGNLIFAGYGISAPDKFYDDFKDKNGNDIDVTGKILVILKYSPGGSDPHNNPFERYEQVRYKALAAKEKGAAGIIIISGPEQGEDKLSRLTYDNAVNDAGIPVINCKRDIIENIFRENGLDLGAIQKEIDSAKSPNSFALNNSSASIEVSIKPLRVTTDNVIGFIEGSDPVLKNEVIVIGAHKDHLGYGAYGSLYSGSDKQIHNGADDNASGTAGVLELAQKFSANKNKLKRSLLFICFSGEEAGLLGSAYFVKSDLFKKLNIVAMLNMDMIGRLVDDKLVIYGTGTASQWNTLIDSINTTYNFAITKTPDGFGPSDHSSFYAKNIPVLHFFSGTHKDYHSPTDDYEKINSAGEEKILKMIYDITLTVAENNSKPEYIKVTTSDTTKRSMGSVKVYVGTIPDYSAAVEGMKLAGVKEGSPAEKGGLKAEDIIIKFGETDVKNIYDYMYAMGGFKPGDEAEIIVLRNNEKVELKVVLGSR